MSWQEGISWALVLLASAATLFAAGVGSGIGAVTGGFSIGFCILALITAREISRLKRERRRG